MTLDKLDALLRVATPAPWEVLAGVAPYPTTDRYVATHGSVLWDERGNLNRVDDGYAIVALRNLAPELLAVARAAEELRKRELDGDPCAVVSRMHLDTTLAPLRAKIGEAT